MLDYKLVEAMAMVVREGGFDRAARALHLTQSAVSQRVRLLEEQTGQVLIARTTPPTATPAGQKLIRHYNQVKRLEDDLSETLVPATEEFSPLPVAVNADSMETWFLDAARPLLKERRVVLDVSMEDQEQTHRLLRNGEVLGCVSSEPKPMQGCSVEYLGCMNYHLLATPGFAAKWFPEGVTEDAARLAPAVIFSRKDDLHRKLLEELFGTAPAGIPAHYIPSTEKFAEVIASGFGYGLIPDIQKAELMRSHELVDLLPERPMPVDLYWHCWNIDSELLKLLTRRIVQGARRTLTATAG